MLKGSIPAHCENSNDIHLDRSPRRCGEGSSGLTGEVNRLGSPVRLPAAPLRVPVRGETGQSADYQGFKSQQHSRLPFGVCAFLDQVKKIGSDHSESSDKGRCCGRETESIKRSTNSTTIVYRKRSSVNSGLKHIFIWIQ
jgi:hypothetical protein